MSGWFRLGNVLVNACRFCGCSVESPAVYGVRGHSLRVFFHVKVLETVFFKPNSNSAGLPTERLYLKHDNVTTLNSSTSAEGPLGVRI